MNIKQLNESIKYILDESYKNIFDEPTMEKYKQEVWDVLQYSYAKIGGIKGSGFNSPDDMIKNFPMWKLNIQNGKVVFVALYKNKFGRKMCAFGTDGSEAGKRICREFLKEEIKSGRSWGEISGPALAVCQKHYSDLLNANLIAPETVKKMLGDSVNIIDDKTYSRKLGNGDEETKLAFGKPGNKIV